jgi:hypothetical protein
MHKTLVDRTSKKDRLVHAVAPALLLTILLASVIAIATTFGPSQTRDAPAAEGEVAVSAAPPIACSKPAYSGDIGPFAFGYVEFDVDPRRPGGVTGFDSWPPGSGCR